MNSKQASITEELFRWVSVIDRYSRAHLNERFKALGVNSSQHFFIRRICMNPGITQDRLQPLIHLNKSNIARAVDALEKEGFVRKEAYARDKRTACLFPTEKALAVHPAIVAEENAWIAELTRTFTPEEKGQLMNLLQRAAEAALAAVQDDGEKKRGAKTPGEE